MQFSRPPPPQGPPPTYAFVTRVYRRNLRPVVLTITVLAALWALFSSIGFLRAINIDKSQHFPKLANFSIALGVLYMAVTIFEAIGFVAALTQKLGLIRIYAMLSVLTTIIVLATGLTRTVVHFVFKNDLITECSNLANGDTIVYRFGLFGPITTDKLDLQEAQAWCRNEWNHDSWSEIVSMLITLFLAVMFTMVALSYYRQMLDPSSPANASRAPSNQVRQGFPSHYNPPYNASVPNLSYGQPYTQYPYGGGAAGPYAPPPGPPPTHDDAFVPPYDGKPPGYTGGDGKYGAEKDDKDPFADFDGPSARHEQDVTSRPGPDGRDTFR